MTMPHEQSDSEPLAESVAEVAELVVDGVVHQLVDNDPAATDGWIDALDQTIDTYGPNRARLILLRLLERSRERGVGIPVTISTPYLNSIPPEDEPAYPGDRVIEHRIRALVRWNAVAMVIRANARTPGVGGHLATYASSASLYEVGFNHFFRGPATDGPADQVFFQGHASPGIYARAFLEGRLDEDDLDHFRAEVGRVGTDRPGLSSYPHPRLMPAFWQFPTVSMGLGPLAAVYQARHNRYLVDRGLVDGPPARVWCFVGDGEMDEPEAIAGLRLAAREHLDNLTFVVCCNLQRLDGPVRGNGKVIQELEATFRGSGWNVLKVLWGSKWDPLFAADHDGVLVDALTRTPDGTFQRLATSDGATLRAEFFDVDARLGEIVAHLSDDELQRLPRGGHDSQKIYAAYSAAVHQEGRPTAVLAHTVKGWALGARVEARNATHQIKAMGTAELVELRDRLGLELLVTEEELADGLPPYLSLDEASAERRYLIGHRQALGGSVPSRRTTGEALASPSMSTFEEFEAGTGTAKASTTAAFVKLLRNLLRDPTIGPRIVPIVPDEGRTFGLDPLFSEFGIYSAVGQRYVPVDASLMLTYREATDGQILEEGITEAGAVAAFQAAGTSHVTSGVATIPFYLFYSMFGFQRTGDSIWQLGDARARGFLLGGTAGRTTLLGEGLQHQDGTSQLFAAAYPYVRAYDPAFAYETAAIVERGISEMFGKEQADVTYYLTLSNEPLHQPAKPAGADEGILAGLYLFRTATPKSQQATILFSGSIAGEALAAAEILEEEHDVGVALYSVTSYKEIRHEAMHATRAGRQSYVAEVLDGAPGPLVAVTDYVTLVPMQIAGFIDRPLLVLGTDGVGMSDSREALRAHFGVDARSIVETVLDAL